DRGVGGGGGATGAAVCRRRRRVHVDAIGGVLNRGDTHELTDFDRRADLVGTGLNQDRVAVAGDVDRVLDRQTGPWVGVTRGHAGRDVRGADGIGVPRGQGVEAVGGDREDELSQVGGTLYGRNRRTGGGVEQGNGRAGCELNGRGSECERL